MSKLNEQLVYAYEMGYRCIKNILTNPDGRILKGGIDKDGYKYFHPFKKGLNIKVHRLVAYQKYGDKLFEEEMEVRHFDNNKLNNSEDNIRIGTHQQNMMDIPKKQRSINAGNHSRKYNPKEVKAFHTGSYKKTMEKFGITSKGTLHNILHRVV